MNDTVIKDDDFPASIRHLRVFDSVAQLHGVRRASEECHLSQPAVTQAIAKLEKQIGVNLLDRRASGSYLNEFGNIFQRRVQRLFAQLEEALLQLGAPAQGSTGRIASRITRSQVRSLIAIVEHGSFAHAARFLGVSQTSLQRAARDLERTLRIPLYVQTASGVMATPGAVEFCRKLKLALQEVHRGIEEIEAARGNFSGAIVIGAMLMAGSAVLATILNEFVRQFPNANVRVLNGNAEDMLRYLRAGDVDIVIGLLRQPTPEDLIDEPLAETPYVVAARHGHPLLSKSKVTLADLTDYDWVIGTPGASRRTRFEELFAKGRKPVARIATCSVPTVRSLLTHSDRLTLLTSHELLFEDDALTAIPFGPIHPAPSVGLTMRQNWLPTGLQQSFVELVKQRIGGSLSLGQPLSAKLKSMGLSLPADFAGAE